MMLKNNHSISVRTSKGIIEPFNREKIVASLTHEAGLTRINANEIALEVEIEIRHLDLCRLQKLLPKPGNPSTPGKG